jgi:hypothetical protein
VRIDWQIDLGDMGWFGGVGAAVYEKGKPISPNVLEGLPSREGEMNHFPGGEAATYKQPTLYEIKLTSDQTRDISFTLTSTCSTSGCEYDPSLGEHGGYRVTGFLDATGDGQSDIDGRMVMLLLNDKEGEPRPGEVNVLNLDPKMQENAFEIFDPKAFGLE